MGRARTDQWLEANFDRLGIESTEIWLGVVKATSKLLLPISRSRITIFS
jgi:hypothetical protein